MSDGQSPEEHLKSGNLEAALEGLQAQVRTKPSDGRLRVFLAQLLAVMGQWDRALNQLEVAAELDAANLPLARTYQAAIKCELLRAEVFKGNASPMVFGDPEPWIALAIEALTRSGQGQDAEAAQIRAEAWDAAPTSSGKIDGEAFDWICDADSRLGPLLEVVVNGRYYWVPFSRIRRLEIDAPTDLRDLVWAPVTLEFSNEGEVVGLIPTRYTGSESVDDPGIALSRKTEWVELAGGEYRGVGQRILCVDGEDHPLLDARSIELSHGATAGAAG